MVYQSRLPCRLPRVVYPVFEGGEKGEGLLNYVLEVSVADTPKVVVI